MSKKKKLTKAQLAARRSNNGFYGGKNDWKVTKQGNFNYQEIMNNFYSWKPDKKDKAGQAMKNTFAVNFLQTGIDSLVASSAAHRDAKITTRLMQTQADLERATAGKLMDKEFAYRQKDKASTYDLENRFDQKSFERQQLAAATKQSYDMDKIGKQALESRRQARTQGGQDRALARETGRQTRLTNRQLDRFKQGSERRENRRANNFARSF